MTQIFLLIFISLLSLIVSYFLAKSVLIWRDVMIKQNKKIISNREKIKRHLKSKNNDTIQRHS